MSASTPPTRPRTSPPARCSSPPWSARTKRIRLGTGTVNMPNTHPAASPARSPCSTTCSTAASSSASAPAACCPTPRRSAISAPTATPCSSKHRPGAGDLGRRPALRHRGQFWNVTTEKTLMPRSARASPEAAAAPASADRRHRRGAVLEGRHRGGGARLGADLGQLPDAAMGRRPTGRNTSRAASGPAARPIRRTGASPRASSSPTTKPPPARYATAPNSPYRYYYSQLLTKLKRAGRTELFKTRPRRSPTTRDARRHLRPASSSTARPTRSPTRSWPSASRSATSARCSTPATTGPTRRSPAARWS